MTRHYRLIMQVDVYPPTTSPSSSADLSFPTLHEPTTLHPITSSTSHQHDLPPTTHHPATAPPSPPNQTPPSAATPLEKSSHPAATPAPQPGHSNTERRRPAVSAPIQRRDFRSVAGGWSRRDGNPGFSGSLPGHAVSAGMNCADFDIFDNSGVSEA